MWKHKVVFSISVMFILLNHYLASRNEGFIALA